MEQSLIPEVMPARPNGIWPKNTWFQQRLKEVRIKNAGGNNENDHCNHCGRDIPSELES